MVWEPLAVTDPVTVKRTVTSGVGVLAASFTVAVTQCCEPTMFVAVFGASVSAAGGPGTHVFAATSDGSPGSCTPLSLLSAYALIVSSPGVAAPW